MKKIALFLVLSLALVMGCSEDPAPMAPQTIQSISPDLEVELNKMRAEHGLGIPSIEGDGINTCTKPDPLPVVSYTIGKVIGSEEIRVPVYMHSEGRRSQGGLLFLTYDDKHMQFKNIERGPAWDNASFVHTALNDMVPGQALFLIIGWEEVTENGVRSFKGIPETGAPWAYVVFEAKQPGKSKIDWDSTDNAPCDESYNGTVCFWRRGEMLLDLNEQGDCIWDVLDYYTVNGVNPTGTMTVEPGYAIVTKQAFTKAAAFEANVGMNLRRVDATHYDLMVNSNLPMLEVTARLTADAVLSGFETELDGFYATFNGNQVVDAILWQTPFGSGKIGTVVFSTAPTSVSLVETPVGQGRPTSVVVSLDYKLNDEFDPFNPGRVLTMQPEEIHFH